MKKVDIYFTAVGMIDIPTEQEILAMMEEIWANPQDLRNMQYQDKYEQMTFLDLI